MYICSALIAFTKSNRYKTVIPFFRIPIVLFSFFFCNRREIRSGFLHTLSYIDRCITTHKWQQQFVEIIEPNVLAFNASCLNNWKCNREADKRTVGRTNNLEPESAFELCSPKKKKNIHIFPSTPNAQSKYHLSNSTKSHEFSLSRNYYDVCLSVCKVQSWYKVPK